MFPVPLARAMFCRVQTPLLAFMSPNSGRLKSVTHPNQRKRYVRFHFGEESGGPSLASV